MEGKITSTGREDLEKEEEAVGILPQAMESWCSLKSQVREEGLQSEGTASKGAGRQEVKERPEAGAGELQGTARRKQMLTQPWGHCGRGPWGWGWRVAWRKKREEPEAAGILTCRGKGRMTRTNDSKLCRALQHAQ